MVLVDEEMKSGRAGFCEAGRQEAALQLGLQRRSLELQQRAREHAQTESGEGRVQSTLHCLLSIAAAAGPRRKPGRSPNRRAQHEV